MIAPSEISFAAVPCIPNKRDAKFQSKLPGFQSKLTAPKPFNFETNKRAELQLNHSLATSEEYQPLALQVQKAFTLRAESTFAAKPL